MAPGGLGPDVIRIFENRSAGCRARVLPAGDAGQMIARIMLDSKRRAPGAHVAVGVDAVSWPRVRPLAAGWGGWTPRNYLRISARARLPGGIVPYDYGIHAFIADTAALRRAGIGRPGSLRDLLDARLGRNILLQDPRTSSPGMSFLLYTKAVLGNSFSAFWHSLARQWLTLGSGWSATYGLFLRGEAMLVWSYTTSEAYHEANGGGGRYKALIFAEGHPVHVEGAVWLKAPVGVVRNPEEDRCAKVFLETMISDEVQRLVPFKNWMLPALADAQLPPVFETLARPEIIPGVAAASGAEIRKITSDWLLAIEGAR